MSGQHYREMQILTASPEALVVMYYEALLRHCRAAAGHCEAGRVAERGASIGKALAIVGELQQALDHEAGGELARQLEALYLFVADQLMEAHLSSRQQAIENAERVLRELHAAWAEIARCASDTPAAP